MHFCNKICGTISQNLQQSIHTTTNDVNHHIQFSLSFCLLVVDLLCFSFLFCIPFVHIVINLFFVVFRCYNCSGKMPVSNLQIKGRHVVRLKCDTGFPFFNFFYTKQIFPATIHLGKLFSPHLDCGNVIYDRTFNESFHQLFESFQNNATIAITRAIRETSPKKLFQEVGLETLKPRCWFRKLYLFY